MPPPTATPPAPAPAAASGRRRAPTPWTTPSTGPWSPRRRPTPGPSGSASPHRRQDGPSRWYESAAAAGDDPRVARLFADFDRVANVLDRPRLRGRRPPPAATTGRHCWRRCSPWSPRSSPRRAGSRPPTASPGRLGRGAAVAGRRPAGPDRAAGAGASPASSRPGRTSARCDPATGATCPTLVSAASDPDQFRRQVAANLLGEAQPAVAQEHWARLAVDPARGVRRATVDAMVDAGRVELRPLLESALGDDDAWVRWKALRGLAELGAGPSRDAVSAVAADPDFRVRLEAGRRPPGRGRRRRMTLQSRLAADDGGSASPRTPTLADPVAFLRRLGTAGGSTATAGSAASTTRAASPCGRTPPPTASTSWSTATSSRPTWTGSRPSAPGPSETHALLGAAGRRPQRRRRGPGPGPAAPGPQGRPPLPPGLRVGLGRALAATPDPDHLLDPGAWSVHLEIRVDGPLDDTRLAKALDAVVGHRPSEHEVLDVVDCADDDALDRARAEVLGEPVAVTEWPPLRARLARLPGRRRPGAQRQPRRRRRVQRRPGPPGSSPRRTPATSRPARRSTSWP